MKQNKHWRLLYFLFTLCPLWLVAQQLTVKGVVKDTDGMEMLGVSIIVKGTQKGVATDGNGRYQIKVQPHDILVFSSVGYLPQEKTVEKSGVIDITLEAEVVALTGTEVVAVAYGATDKKSFTGSMTTVKEETIKGAQTNNVVKALEGAVAGVQISTGSGQPGSSASVRIRGIGSINASSNPLVILDGVPYEGSLNAINNSDVESINILKDASAAAL